MILLSDKNTRNALGRSDVSLTIQFFKFFFFFLHAHSKCIKTTFENRLRAGEIIGRAMDVIQKNPYLHYTFYIKSIRVCVGVTEKTNTIRF